MQREPLDLCALLKNKLIIDCHYYYLSFASLHATHSCRDSKANVQFRKLIECTVALQF